MLVHQPRLGERGPGRGGAEGERRREGEALERNIMGSLCLSHSHSLDLITAAEYALITRRNVSTLARSLAVKCWIHVGDRDGFFRAVENRWNERTLEETRSRVDIKKRIDADSSGSPAHRSRRSAEIARKSRRQFRGTGEATGEAEIAIIGDNVQAAVLGTACPAFRYRYAGPGVRA